MSGRRRPGCAAKAGASGQRRAPGGGRAVSPRLPRSPCVHPGLAAWARAWPGGWTWRVALGQQRNVPALPGARVSDPPQSGSPGLWGRAWRAGGRNRGLVSRARTVLCAAARPCLCAFDPEGRAGWTLSSVHRPGPVTQHLFGKISRSRRTGSRGWCRVTFFKKLPDRCPRRRAPYPIFFVALIDV